MTITRAGPPVSQSKLFGTGTTTEPVEVDARCSWSTSLKTVETAKDKEEGLKQRAKGKRGGDSGKGNTSTFTFENDQGNNPPVSPSRREYSYKPSDRNPLMAGQMEAAVSRPGKFKAAAPAEKALPKTHKVVNLGKRVGCLESKDGNAYTVLAGAGEKTQGHGAGRKCFGKFNQETMPPPQKPSGKGGRRAFHKTDPWKYEKEYDTVYVNAVSTHPQRFGYTPEYARKTHTFENAPKGPRYPNYKINPPFSVDA
eukprot:TRINITY_DN9602_c2_g1_i1.p1 TRINITY_DN9602_c2_g1~~TRINITY_DN9602_c2_g1_i1.p1  ORF type:complete len:254 (+),score=55.12 TRINITY_DN9602_c2_g1_i1:47-808(+)